MGFLQPHGRHRRGDGEAAISLVSRTRCGVSSRCAAEPGPATTQVPVLQRTASRRAAPRDKRPPMTKSFCTLADVAVKGKRVLLRVDLNVPMENGRVTDATRLERVAPTITEISEKGGKVILLAHFGRPQGRDPKESLTPVAAALSGVLKRQVAFADDCIGDAAAQAVAAMTDG